MPSKTFENLNQEKQNQIFASLLKEYSTYKLTDAMISRIVKDCEIPRGSFYSYFTDLDDSYLYVLKRVLKEVHFNVYEHLKTNHKDSMDVFYQTTKSFLQNINGSVFQNFYKLYFEFNQYTLMMGSLNYNFKGLKLYLDNKEVIPNADVAFQMATMVSHATIKEVLTGSDFKISLDNLKRSLDLLRTGLKKEK